MYDNKTVAIKMMKKHKYGYEEAKQEVGKLFYIQGTQTVQAHQVNCDIFKLK